MDSKEEPVMYVCDICGKGIANKCNLKRHKLMHSGYSESVRCEVCQKVLSSEGNLKRHMRMHMGIQDRQECSVCNKTFSNVGNLRRHMRTHQANAEQFECKICKKSFPYEDYLKKHIKTVHSSEVKPEPENSGLPHIESFIKREDGMDEGSELSASQSLNRRSDSDLMCGSMNTPEPKKGAEDEESSDDDDSSSQHSNKDAGNSRHLSVQNGEPENVGPNAELREKLCPPEECNICRLVLTDPAQVKLSVWRMHLDMRSMKKQGSENVSFEFNCTVCGKFLSNKGNLKRHMLLLHKKDLIGADVDVTVEQMRAQCEICGRIVANKGNLKRHMEKVHVIKRVGGDGSAEGDDRAGSRDSFYPGGEQDGARMVNGSPPVKKRRSAKHHDTEAGGGQGKVGLKIRLKNAQAGHEDKRQFNDSGKVDGKPREDGQIDNGIGDNGANGKGSHRWRSRSFDDVYPVESGPTTQPNDLGESYSCPMCRRRFVCEENYKRHMKRHRSYKPPKTLDPASVAEQPPPPPMPEQQAVCNICGIQMPFGAALQHHLTTVHRDVGDASAELTTSTACSPQLQNDIVNWSYPPILTRFRRRDDGLTDRSYHAFPTAPKSDFPANMSPTKPPLAALSAPTTPLRKFVLGTPEGGSPVSAGLGQDPDDHPPREGPPVLVIMQPRCT